MKKRTRNLCWRKYGEYLYYSIFSNYPNPFNPSTITLFSAIEQGHVDISIYSINGQKIKTLEKSSIRIGVRSFA
ncbi:MAG: T9SS type A sorting domain-containing protein [Candidatus Cloacimonetes bacterium]|jgi:hypothetical protein|nr:T9SS type A sorting domain-containing protein [Candidatus Cloacimonadota bacterium]MBT4332237.1 T9SS type A sorting domain-containing protein [Candidatus Cloacimonadota bacterium]MBT4575463.1 T9SS type A sorting domain-containing protein [Candidatus Cloacimonadota bacterium]MBT5419331.1 T9SS type A sorting domain-containing protein [Candidatus Cloacimonadota bacterium]